MDKNRKSYLKRRKALLLCWKKYRNTHRDEMRLKDRLRNRTISGRFGRCKYYSKQRNLEWSLTKEQYIQLLSVDKCHYCEGKLPETSYGLDRKDSTKGYFIENVVPCCKDCNTMKNHLITYDEMVMLWNLRKQRKEHAQR